MRRAPAFTAVAVATLAIGIGINAAVFSVTDAVLFKGFRLIDRNDRLLYIGTQKNGRGCCASFPDFVDWRAQARSFVDLAAVADRQIALSDGNESGTEHYDATEITPNAFQLLGQRPAIGRDFTASDGQPGAEPAAILRHSFWERRYGRDPAVIGRTIRINGIRTTVVGVMPPNFSFPQNQDLWIPLVPTPISKNAKHAASGSCSAAWRRAPQSRALARSLRRSAVVSRAPTRSRTRVGCRNREHSPSFLSAATRRSYTARCGVPSPSSS
jgi:putative ABC transport system permease protein